MGEPDRRTFAEGIIALGNLSFGGLVIAQFLPTNGQAQSPTALGLGSILITCCYLVAYKILKVKGGGR